MREDAPSATARLIALSTVFLHRHPPWCHLVPPLAAEATLWFLEAGPRRPHRTLQMMPRPWFRSIVLAAERLAVPGSSSTTPSGSTTWRRPPGRVWSKDAARW